MNASATLVFIGSLALGAAAWILYLWAIRRAERHFTHNSEKK